MKTVQRNATFKLVLLVFVAMSTLVFALPVSNAGQTAVPPIEPVGLMLGGMAAYPDSLALGFSWYDGSSNETGFRLEMKQGVDGAYSVVATVGANITSLGGIYLPRDGNTYLFRVRAFNASGESASSNEVAVDAETGSQVPPPDPGDDPEPAGDLFSDEQLITAPRCLGGLYFGKVDLSPGARCCFNEFPARRVKYEMEVRSNIGTPRAKVKIFRNGERIAREGFHGFRPFGPYSTFPVTTYYKVCPSYPLANRVGGPNDVIEFTVRITEAN